jgi:hypothetical protein
MESEGAGRRHQLAGNDSGRGQGLGGVESPVEAPQRLGTSEAPPEQHGQTPQGAEGEPTGKGEQRVGAQGGDDY